MTETKIIFVRAFKAKRLCRTFYASYDEVLELQPLLRFRGNSEKQFIVFASAKCQFKGIQSLCAAVVV